MAHADTNAPQDELACAEATLAELERKTREARARVQALRARNAAVRESSPLYITPPSPPTAQGSLTPDRIRLFRQLFRGREDVFARLWTNQKKQTTGYAPACANEWIRSVCEKPRIKCGECPNQAFLPVDDKAIQGHLQGQHVLGVYPLLRDETCWFLAVDFDGTG